MTDETPVTEPPKDEQHEPPKEEHHEPPKEESHEPPKGDDMPEWGKSLMSSVDALAERVEALAPKPDMPADGDVVPDESPVKVPWTHKKIFG